MWQPEWEGSWGENGYMYGWIPFPFSWNDHNIVNRLYLNVKQKVLKKDKVFMILVVPE